MTKIKQTQIGKIPENWEVVKFIDICTKLKSGGTPLTSKGEYYNGKIPFVKIEDITNAGKYLTNTKMSITEEGLKSSNTWLIPKNSILLAIYGSLGAVSINKIELTTNQAILGIILDKEKANTEFIYYLFLYLRKNLLRQAKHTTQANLTAEIIKKLKVPLPPFPEQKAIADILSTIDEVIQKIDEIIAKTEKLKKGLMQELLTKGIGHTKFKDTKIGRIPEDWEVIDLENIAEIHDSKRIPLSEMERNKRKGIYPYCGANGIIDYIDDYIFDGEFVLLAEDGGDYSKFGNSAYVMEGKFWVNNHAHILKAIKDKTTNHFLLYNLNFFDLNFYIFGTTRKKLNQEQMRKIRIPLPPIIEQQKITSILIKIDKKLELERRRKEKFERIKKGLMNNLLTGNKRIKFRG